jgi:peptide chain release factor 1
VFESVAPLLDEHQELERALADPALHDDAARARTIARRYAELTAVVDAYRGWSAAAGDLEAALELAVSDPDFAAEARGLESLRDERAAVLEELLAPRDPDDARDTILEVKAGVGGEESALFAAELLRMYERYATSRGWVFDVVSSTDTELGGVKDATVSVRARGNPAPADGVWAHLKYEGGVHRVQRVPVTESQGRIQTSAVGVLVVPEADDVADDDILADMLGPNALRVDVYRSSGPGGQSVNTTDSAVRITHLDTGIVVSCQNEKSQIQNREQAMRILKSRLLDLVHAEQDEAAAAQRRSQVRTLDRSERIRTYNFPENRVADHRTGYKANTLDAVLDGDLDALIESAVRADREATLSGGDPV